MYVRKRELPCTFPPNYRGNLSLSEEKCEHAPESKKHHTYRIRKNSYCKPQKDKKTDKKPAMIFDSFSGDELLLLGLLIFLYVGCDHSKENLILMGAIAYLLFAKN